VKAVIIAGGLGTRLRSVTGDTLPKALVPVAGVPIIHRQLRLLKRYGCTSVTATAGHLADVLANGCTDEAERLGLRLTFVSERMPLGTGGGLPAAHEFLRNEPFIALCGDIAVEMDLKRLVAFHNRHHADATIVVHPNDHPQTSDLVVADEADRVQRILPRGNRDSDDYRNLVFGSVYVLSSRVFDFIEPDAKQDLNNDIFPRMIRGGARVLAYNTPEYLKDVGTVERLALVDRDYSGGRVDRMNWNCKRPAVFFDRDGVLMQDVEPEGVTRPDDVRLLPQAAEAVRLVNDAGILAIVVTNQPGIAKGFLSLENLNRIHGRLDMKLGETGAWLDRIYYCPHHPESGFDGERPEYKVTCDCRKPSPGMLLRATAELPVDLHRSILVGDSARDIGAARAAGVAAYGVRTGHGCRDCVGESAPDLRCNTAFDAVHLFLETLDQKPYAR
jgi:histidinol-phosphate phosphatase family protein